MTLFKALLYLLFLTFSFTAFSQDMSEEEKLLREGVKLHDEGKFKAAVKKYDAVIKMDESNVIAYAEKAFSLMEMQEYNKAAKCCEKALDVAPEDFDKSMIYTTYANIMDMSGNSEEAIKVYNRAINDYPDFYQLHFNKGITLTGMNQYDEAISCFQTSLVLNPNHPGSHNALARTVYGSNKVPSLMAVSRFFVLEPEGKRASANIPLVQELIKGNAKSDKKGKNTTIYVDASSLEGAEEGAEDDFAMIELMLSLTGSLSLSKEIEGKASERKDFQTSFEMVCSSLEENQKKGKGFYWEYYAPYFVEMKVENLTETFSYLVFASTGEKEVVNWLKSNEEALKKFYTWSNSYEWPKVDVH